MFFEITVPKGGPLSSIFGSLLYLMSVDKSPVPLKSNHCHGSWYQNFGKRSEWEFKFKIDFHPDSRKQATFSLKIDNMYTPETNLGL